MPPTPDAPPTDPYEIYDKSIDRLVMIGEPVCEQVRAAFWAGWKAREDQKSGGIVKCAQVTSTNSAAM